MDYHSHKQFLKFSFVFLLVISSDVFAVYGIDLDGVHSQYWMVGIHLYLYQIWCFYPKTHNSLKMLHISAGLICTQPKSNKFAERSYTIREIVWILGALLSSTFLMQSEASWIKSLPSVVGYPEGTRG